MDVSQSGHGCGAGRGDMVENCGMYCAQADANTSPHNRAIHTPHIIRYPGRPRRISPGSGKVIVKNQRVDFNVDTILYCYHTKRDHCKRLTAMLQI